MSKIILKLKGGLGNQLFQYAAARNLAIKNSSALELDLSWYHAQGSPDIPRLFLLDKYKMEFALADKISSEKKYSKHALISLLAKVQPSYHYRFHKICLKAKEDMYLDGYYQSYKYFSEIRTELLGELQLRNEPSASYSEFCKTIEASVMPVSLHIRRGDYIKNATTNNYHGVCSLDYYEKALKYISNKFTGIKVFIFSDDIEWVRDNFKTKHEVVYVSNTGLPDFEELLLMSKCKHNIIANSSYSWWGAWLNSNLKKVVIAPERWLSKKIDTSDLLPAEWIKL